MAITICHASIDERGKANSGQAGDQTKREVCTRTWYSKPWGVMIRCNDQKIAKKAAEIAKKLADSNLVGYDQYQRNTLYQALKKNNWDVDKYIKSGVKTETDCSAFIYAVFCCLIPKLRSDNNAPTTSTMANVYPKYGFTAYGDKKYLTTDANLKIGDILVRPGSHTVLAISEVVVKKDEPKKQVLNKVESAKSKSENYVGTYTVTGCSELTLRYGAGKTKAAITTMPEGAKVVCYGFYDMVDNTPWLLVKYKNYTGFCSKKYLK